MHSSVKAASYNIHSAIGIDQRCDPRRILDIVLATEAAVVGLQEVDARLRGRQRFDQFDYFSANSGMECIAGPNVLEHRGHYGNVLMTRLPIESVRLICLPTIGAEPRGAQARELLAAVSGHDGPTLFMGDFNVWHPRSYVRGLLGAPMNRTLAPLTYPAYLPMLALDRIWTRPPGVLREVRAIRGRRVAVASDHLPVVASLTL